jgi:hypothetical protein
MRETIFILIVVFALAALTAIRYRKPIFAAWQIWRSFKEAAKQPGPGERKLPRPDHGGTLVKCANCGVWTPEDRAVRMRGGAVYCSKACLETKAKTA